MEMKVPPYKMPPLSDFKVTRKPKKQVNPYQFLFQSSTTKST